MPGRTSGQGPGHGSSSSLTGSSVAIARMATPASRAAGVPDVPGSWMGDGPSRPAQLPARRHGRPDLHVPGSWEKPGKPVAVVTDVAPSAGADCIWAGGGVVLGAEWGLGRSRLPQLPEPGAQPLIHGRLKFREVGGRVGPLADSRRRLLVRQPTPRGRQRRGRDMGPSRGVGWRPGAGRDRIGRGGLCHARTARGCRLPQKADGGAAARSPDGPPCQPQPVLLLPYAQ